MERREHAGSSSGSARLLDLLAVAAATAACICPGCETGRRKNCTNPEDRTIESHVASLTLYCEHPNPGITLSDGSLMVLLKDPLESQDAVYAKGPAAIPELARIALRSPRMAFTALELCFGIVVIEEQRALLAGRSKGFVIQWRGEDVMRLWGTGEPRATMPEGLDLNEKRDLVRHILTWLKDKRYLDESFDLEFSWEAERDSGR